MKKSLFAFLPCVVLISGGNALAGQYRINFDADTVPADILITTSDILETINGFTGFRILSASGTDGTHNIIGLYPQGTTSVNWGDSGPVTVDNLFNFLGGDTPDQLSLNGFAYYTESVGSVSEVYRFYYGKRYGDPSGPSAYQGIPGFIPPVTPPSFPTIPPDNININTPPFKVISNVKFTPSVPGPLPIVGIGAAFGYSRRLRKKIKASKTPEVISTIG